MSSQTPSVQSGMMVQSGMIVHGQQATIHRLSPETPASSALLNGIFSTVNEATSHTHPPYIPASFKRLLEPQQILHELGQDFIGFAVTIPPDAKHNTSPDHNATTSETNTSSTAAATEVIACGCAVPLAKKPYLDHIVAQSANDSAEDKSHVKTTVQRKASAKAPLPGVVDWELKLLAVRPQFMKQGIAGSLLKLLEQAVAERVRNSTSKSTTIADERSGEERRTRKEEGVVVVGAQGEAECGDFGDVGAGKKGESDGGCIGGGAKGESGAPTRQGNGRGKGEGIRLMVTTMRELNGYWYERRGYLLVDRMKCDVGTLGGTEPFEIWHMDKIVILD